MKKHTKLILIIGIVFCYTPFSCASSNNNGPYSPAVVIPAITHFIQTSLAAAASQIVIHEILNGWQSTKVKGENLWEYLTATQPKLATTTHQELKSRPDLNKNTFTSLPDEIQTILKKEQASGTGEHQFILLYGIPGTGKTTLAQQIALHTGGNYYHVHQKSLDNYSDATIARFLRAYVEMISHDTTDGKVSTLHLEEFGKQFGKSMHNDVHSLNHGRYENTWKELLQDLEKNYPKVRVIACSNFGQDEKAEIFHNAIANERAHIIKINAPNECARKAYFTSTCTAHLENQGVKQSKHQTQVTNNQSDRDNNLTRNHLVTAAMHAAAQHKHDDKINQVTIPWTLGKLIQPWLWEDIWNKNSTARNLKTQGYFTPIVNYDLKNATTEQAQLYAELTKNLRYRQLNEITESARIEKLAQIERMKKRTNQQNSAYIIDTTNRTFSLPIQNECDNNSSNNDTITTIPFGKIQPHDLVIAAAIARKQYLDQHQEITAEINKELSTIPVTDIKDLAKKLIAKRQKDIMSATKDLIEAKKNSRS